MPSETTHFHYDRPPFEGAYIATRKAVDKIADEIIKYVRVKGGLYAIDGGKSVGKTALLRRIARTLDVNEAVIWIPATDRLELIPFLAEALGLRKRADEAEVLAALLKIRKTGRNVVLAIDDANEMPEAERAAAAGLVAALPWLRVVATGAKALLGRRAPRGFRDALAAKYRLRRLSFLQGISYVREVSWRALALSQYENPIGLRTAAALSFFANRNLDNLNYLCGAAIEEAWRAKAPKVRVRDVLRAARANFGRVKDNLWHKLQKIFVGLIVLSGLFYTSLAVWERFAAVEEVGLRARIAEQEKKLSN